MGHSDFPLVSRNGGIKLEVKYSLPGQKKIADSSERIAVSSLTTDGFKNIELIPIYTEANRFSRFQLKAEVPKSMLQDDFAQSIFRTACEISEAAGRSIGIEYESEDIKLI